MEANPVPLSLAVLSLNPNPSAKWVLSKHLMNYDKSFP